MAREEATRTNGRNSPASALRTALEGPFPELRVTALAIIASALEAAPTYGEAAENLGVSPVFLQRIRKKYAADL